MLFEARLESVLATRSASAKSDGSRICHRMTVRPD
jgi:hypothetical protein